MGNWTDYPWCWIYEQIWSRKCQTGQGNRDYLLWLESPTELNEAWHRAAPWQAPADFSWDLEQAQPRHMFAIKMSLKIHIDKLHSLEPVCETLHSSRCSSLGSMFLVIFPDPVNLREMGEGHLLSLGFHFLNLKGMISLQLGLAWMSSERLISEYHLSWHAF